MKRDNTSIGVRIKKLGITQKKVCERLKMNTVTLSRIISGADGYGSKESIESIHKYLDTVKT